ncbi:MAG: DUF2200 family protein [Flavobacterium sp.]
MHQVIQWLTGYDDNTLQSKINKKITLSKFFQNTHLNPNNHLITGMICGYKTEEIENTLTKQIRFFGSIGRRIG